MAMEIPDTIAAYFTADRERSAAAVSGCFTEDAVVRDEGNIHIGRNAIRQWKSESSQKYTYTVEPHAITREGDRIVVTSHLVGDFPGSPVDLRYAFVLQGEKIAALEILP